MFKRELLFAQFDPTGNSRDGFGFISRELCDGYILHNLASGEEYITEKTCLTDENSLVNGLKMLALQQVGEKTELVTSPDPKTQESLEQHREFLLNLNAERLLLNSSERVLSNFDNFSPKDATHWAKMIAKANSVAERVFPHWVFLSIAADIKLSHPYSRFSTLPPKFIKSRPTTTELNQTGFTKQEIDTFSQKNPPVLIGKAIPIMGWYDEYSHSVRPMFTLMRKGSGLAEGKFTFPGGRAKGLLDFAAIRELGEEEAFTEFMGCWWPYSESDILVAEQIAVIDQVLLLPSGELKHFFINAFSFEIRLGGEANETLGMGLEKAISDFVPLSEGPGKEKWNIVPLEKVSQQDILDKTATPERICLEILLNQSL